MLRIYLSLVAAMAIACFYVPIMIATLDHQRSKPRALAVILTGLLGFDLALLIGTSLITSALGLTESLDKGVLPCYCGLCLIAGFSIEYATHLCVRKKDLLNMLRDLARGAQHVGTWALCAMRQHPEDSRAAIAQVIMLPNPAVRPFRDTALIQHVHHHCRCRSAAA